MSAVDTPRILAIADVRLAASRHCRDELASFYSDAIGLERLAGQEAEGLIFRGGGRRGPRLIVELREQPAVPFMRRDLVIQMGSLTERAERLLEWGIVFVWSRGWSYYDRRLIALDPAGHRVELVTSHGF